MAMCKCDGCEAMDPPVCYKCGEADCTWESILASPDESRPWCVKCIVAMRREDGYEEDELMIGLRSWLEDI